MSLLSQLPRRRADATPTLVMVIVCAGVVLASLDLFIVNVALPDIARDLHTTSLSSLSWVLNAYAIVYAAMLVLLGRLSESHRRENGFLLGVALFTAASAACGLADDLTMLVVFRVIQAIGAALLTPTSLSLVLATTSPERRHGAVRAWTAIGGLAAALGPVVGGLLVAASWRWVFLVNVPIGIAAVLLGWRRLPRVEGHPVPRPDALGAVLVTVGVAALTLGLVKGNDWGWGSAATVVSLVGAVIALALFALHCARHHNPLIDATLFKVRTFSGASVVALVFSVAFGAMLLSVVLWDQNVWGWSALQTGLAVAPGPLMVPLFAFLVAGRLIARFGAGPVIGAGATIFAAGVAWWALAAGLRPDYAGDMLGGMLLSGVGVGLTLPTFMATGASSLPPQSFATGSAVVNMLRQVGLAVGVAVLVAVLGSPGSPTGELAAFRHGWETIAGVSLAAALAGVVLLRAPRRATATAGAALATDH
ncbi:MAG TPA: DHA2 family efflux MFS transporter permease subunit [Solirubrobacteraceae bacterium]|nr:DHA2 family efflux MFS transporter permease subunit [Solirubrobacteraceae bacterium]